ncbi:protein FAR1-RELATED SEQUENCE 5-like, partial [Carex rostrata]
MSSCDVSNSVEVGSNDIYVDGDENNPRIHIQSDLIDPYIYYEEACEVDEPLSDNTSKPYVGMEFNTHEEAYTFYNNYALFVGFSVRKATSTTNKNGLSSIRYVCSKEGKSEWHKRKERPTGSSIDFATPEKECGITRCDCKASFRIRKLEGGKWKVSVFEEDHKHELITSPSKIRNLRSHKLMTGVQKDTIRKLSAQNVGTTQIHEYMGAQHDGKGNIRFKKKDISNLIAGDNAKLIGVDVHTTLMYFKQKQDDPEFFYSVLADEDGIVKNIFWIDGRGRRAYKEFGDVVTFDTTYQTNKFNMPFAPFIGVNHHRQSILFGMALLKCETAENFCWLFKTFLEAMYDKHPSAIITDQDPAMRKAIELIFPTTLHRCCQWHIMRKARERFAKLYHEKPGFEDELKATIIRSKTVSDFEKRWQAMCDTYDVHNATYIRVMYRNREQWVPAYFRGTFFADMSTTQRSESMNAIFKLLVNNHKSVYQFVLQIEKLIEGIWQRESDEDIKNINEVPQLWSRYKMEVKARQVYTRQVFTLFKEMVQDSTLGDYLEVERGVSYKVNIFEHPEIYNYVPESYTLEVDKERCKVSCDCKGYITSGILCPHAIKIMQVVGITHLPDHYILKRWTKGANASAKRSINERSMDSGESAELLTLRKASLKSDWMELTDLGATSAEAFICMKEIIASGKQKLLSVLDKQAQGGCLPSFEANFEEESGNDQF